MPNLTGRRSSAPRARREASDPARQRSLLERVQTAVAGRYVIERPIGRGGSATVYLGADQKHDRPVAIKALDPTLTTALGAERFLREIRITAALQHPHILPLIDSGSEGGVLFFVSPYVEGPTLRERLAASGSLPLAEALRLGREVADALAYAHRRGVVHLDIKPENILLSDGHAVIADFGIARAVCDGCRQTVAAPQLIVGTPEYMSPEQAEGVVSLDARSDIYSLACVLYELLTGRPPFVGETLERLVQQHWNAPPPGLRETRPDVPLALEAVLCRALAKRPDERPATVAEIAAALRSACTQSARETRPAYRQRAHLGLPRTALSPPTRSYH